MYTNILLTIKMRKYDRFGAKSGIKELIERGRKSPPSVWNQLDKLYDYETMKVSFPWVETFRAGFICTYKPPYGPAQLLFVHQKGSKKAATTIPPYWGPPKGCANDEDHTALQTAIRELYEETGIAIQPRDILPTVVVIPREPIREMMILFFAKLPCIPETKVDDVEISECRFFNLQTDTPFLVSNASLPTKEVLRVLNCVIDLW